MRGYLPDRAQLLARARSVAQALDLEVGQHASEHPAPPRRARERKEGNHGAEVLWLPPDAHRAIPAQPRVTLDYVRQVLPLPLRADLLAHRHPHDRVVDE